MARILLSLSDAEVLRKVENALAETKHEIIREDLTYDLGLMAVAEKIMAEKPDVVVMDYWAEDAGSVKLMQTVTDLAARPEFILLEGEGEEAGREQVMMAINEGARAFLPRDFQSEALLNYVERALSGPGRLRLKALENYGPEAAINRLEENLGDLRIKTSGYQKLIDYLLATPVSAQPRKVLVVSDSPYQLELLKKILDEHNFAVLAASNPADGLELALKERPRIIVSDLELEGQTGIEFCQAVKFTNKLVPCYFVICTANQDKIGKVMEPGNGVDDCLVKPSGHSDTVDFISRVALGLLL
jgi:Response regulators consisting of a CheY-like receiver domain and a winged-helix DNA-binding domain